LRNELRGWVRDILLDTTTTNRGYFDRSGVERLLDRSDQEGGNSKEIFSLATLELWHRSFA
jgi:hypothetical protein